MAQSVEPLTSAQVMISQFMGSSPTSGSVLTAQSLEPRACFGFCVLLALCPSPILSLWVVQSGKGMTSAQVMISQFMGSSPTLGSALTVRSLLVISVHFSLPLSTCSLLK